MKIFEDCGDEKEPESSSKDGDEATGKTFNLCNLCLSLL